jgi:hypothetical protein
MAHCVPVDRCPGTAARAEADIRVGGNRLSPSLSIAGHRAVMDAIGLPRFGHGADNCDVGKRELYGPLCGVMRTHAPSPRWK